MLMFQEYSHGVQINLYIRDLDNLFPEDFCSEFILDGIKSLAVEYRGEKRIPATKENIAIISKFFDSNKDEILSLYAKDAKFEPLGICPRWSTADLLMTDGFINQWNIFLEHRSIVDPEILSSLTEKTKKDLLTKLQLAGFTTKTSESPFPLFVLTQRFVKNTSKGLEVFQDYKLTLPTVLNTADLKKLKGAFEKDMRGRVKMIYSTYEKDQRTEMSVISHTYINDINTDNEI